MNLHPVRAAMPQSDDDNKDVIQQQPPVSEESDNQDEIQEEQVVDGQNQDQTQIQSEEQILHQATEQQQVTDESGIQNDDTQDDQSEDQSESQVQQVTNTEDNHEGKDGDEQDSNDTNEQSGTYDKEGTVDEDNKDTDKQSETQDQDDDDDEEDNKQDVTDQALKEAGIFAEDQNQSLELPLPSASENIADSSSSFPAPDPATSQEPIIPADTPPLLASGDDNNHVNPWDLPDVSPKASIGASIVVLLFSIAMLTLGGFYLRRAYRRRKLRQMLRQDMYDLGDEAYNDTPIKSGRKSSLASPLRKMRKSEKAVKWQSEQNWEDSWKEDEVEKGGKISEGESDDERFGRGYGLRRC
jgi:hypothetical protein